MTYASDLGLKVGSKIKYLSGGSLNKHDAFDYGEVITLHSDPYENRAPLFEDSNGNTEFFDVVKRKWEHYKEEEKDMTFELKAGDKVEVINTGIFHKTMVNVGDIATFKGGSTFSCPTWDDTQFFSKDFWSKYLKPYVSAKPQTPFEKAGYTKDTKFKLLMDYSSYKKGDVVTLHHDDGSSCPMFTDGKSNNHYVYLPNMRPEGDQRIEVYVEEAIKIKFPCCVSTSEIKDVDTFEAIKSLFVVNGAEISEGDYDWGVPDFEYYGVTSYGSAKFWDWKSTYSSDGKEDSVTAYSVAKLLGLVAKEEPVAEVPPLLTLFTIGTEVKIAKESKYYVESDLHNPVNTRGVLIGNKPNYRDDEYIYRVRWENGTTNCYEIHDLVLWEDDVSVASQEAITERLEDNPSVGIDYSVMGSTASTDPLISITQEVKYTVVIKGTTFTFTQEELDALTEELLGFTTL